MPDSFDLKSIIAEVDNDFSDVDESLDESSEAAMLAEMLAEDDSSPIPSSAEKAPLLKEEEEDKTAAVVADGEAEAATAAVDESYGPMPLPSPPLPASVSQPPAAPAVATTTAATAEVSAAAGATHWACRCFALVAFHVRDGQIVERTFPADALTEAEQKAVAYASLPDTNSALKAVTSSHWFRVRRRGDSIPLFALSPVEQEFDYGYVLFKRWKDPTQPRGFIQKSLVLITALALPKFFMGVVARLGALYFEHGTSVLDAGVDAMRRWPVPQPRALMPLPLLGTVLRLKVPYFHAAARLLAAGKAAGHGASVGAGADLVGAGTAAPAVTLQDALAADGGSRPRSASASQSSSSEGLFESVALYSVFQGFACALWPLWELAITGQPVLVLCDTPELSGQVVAAIVSLIAPLPYGGDYRPYLTIYDPDFNQFSDRGRTGRDSSSRSSSNNSSGSSSPGSSGGAGLPACVVGATNPFLLKSFASWPNLLYLNSRFVPSASAEKPTLPRVGRRRAELGDLFPCADHKKTKPVLIMREKVLMAPRQDILRQLLVVPRDRSSSRSKGKKGGKSGGSAPQLLISPNSAHDEVSFGADPVASVTGLVVPAVAINSALLRRHFRELTHAFLAPFEDYFKPRLRSIASNATLSSAASSSSSSSSSSSHFHRREPKRAPPGSFVYDLQRLLEPFDEDVFLRRLERRGPPKAFKGTNWQKLYRRFLASPMFRPWFNRKRAMVESQVGILGAGRVTCKNPSSTRRYLMLASSCWASSHTFFFSVPSHTR